MKFIDMLQMSASNLWKRKWRTVLTILGVIIGVASIVVMVSLGIGLSKSMMDEYSSYGSITQITVEESYSAANSNKEIHLDDELIENLKNIEHVESVYPVLNFPMIALCGGYYAYINVKGMPIESIMAESIEVGEGSLPTADMNELELFYGSTVIENFQNAKTGAGFYDTGVRPNINLMEDPIFFVLDTNAYYASKNSSQENKTKPPKKYLIKAAGIEKTPESGFSTYSWYSVCDIDKLIPLLKKEFKNKPIPGQPTTKNGKPYKKIFYSQLYVNVDDMDNVVAVQQKIQELGYNAYSNAEFISSAQTSMGYVEAVLGGIGAVSLLVAAIGIANTMMMSIYERTREIGVMKVLGCDMGNIRMLFLLEAGMIGFVGGLFGLGISYGVSAIINYIVAGSAGGGGYSVVYIPGSSISYIPIWLSFLSVVFATVIAMIAGFFPAQKAMKLSPLAAIRND